MDDDKRTRQNELNKLLQKRDAVTAEINAMLERLEARRKALFAELDVGSDTAEYTLLLSHIIRWLRIVAAVKCGQKPPAPIAETITEEERNLYDRAVGIVKSMQKLK